MANEVPKEAGAEFFAPKKEVSAPLDTAAEVTSISRTVKIIEDKYSNLRKKVQIDEQNSLAAHKKAFEDIKAINSEILEIKHEIEDVKEKILLIISELKASVKAEEFQELKKYIEFWEPMNFVTRNEIQKVVEKMMEQKFGQ